MDEQGKEAESKTMSAFIVGATGMVGKKLVEELVQSQRFHRVVALGRRPVEYEGPGKEKLEQHTVNFDKLEDHADLFVGHDVGLCTLGTFAAGGTIADLERIDHDYPLHVAQLYRDANPDKPTHFCLLTSAWTSSNSWFAAIRVKGRLTDDVKSLGFTQLSIFKPAFMTLQPGQPPREVPYMSDRIGGVMARPLDFVMCGRAAVEYWTVAKAMRQVAEKTVKEGTPNVSLYSTLEMKKMVK